MNMSPLHLLPNLGQGRGFGSLARQTAVVFHDGGPLFPKEMPVLREVGG